MGVRGPCRGPREPLARRPSQRVYEMIFSAFVASRWSCTATHGGTPLETSSRCRQAETSDNHKGAAMAASVSRLDVERMGREAISLRRILAEQAFSRAGGAPLVRGNSIRLLRDAA